MIRLLADENFNNHIINGVWRINPDAEIVRVQDTDMYSKPDPDMLAWAAEHGYVLFSHDYKTIPKFVNRRLEAGLLITGVVMVRDDLPIKEVIDDLLLIIGASNAEEWVNRVEHLPL